MNFENSSCPLFVWLRVMMGFRETAVEFVNIFAVILPYIILYKQSSSFG